MTLRQSRKNRRTITPVSAAPISPSVTSEGPVSPGVEVDDARRGLDGHLGPEVGLISRLVAGVAHCEALLVEPLKAHLVLAVDDLLELRELGVLEGFENVGEVDLAPLVVLSDRNPSDRPAEVGPG